jgi:hypothetical protein
MSRWGDPDVHPGLLLLVLAGIGTCVLNYRAGIVVVVAAGLLQDPIRKAADGQSPYMMGLVFAFFGATILGALLTNPARWWRRRDWLPLRVPATLYGFVLVLQCLVTYIRTGSMILIAIGLAAYLGPALAVVLGSWAGAKRAVVTRFLVAYVVFVAVLASGIALWQAGYRWALLKSIGAGLIVYDWELGAIVLPSGFFRAPEVASWHCATATCVVVILASARRASLGRRVALGSLATFFVWAVLVTGRRKGVAEVAIFIAFFAILQIWVRGRLGRFGTSIAAFVVVIAFAFQQYGLAKQAEGQIGSMRERSTFRGGIPARMIGSVTSIPMVVSAAGFLGTGLGTGTQGAQHFRPKFERWAGVSESGLARLFGELGVPGVAVAALLLWRLMAGLRRRLRVLTRPVDEDPSLTLGLMALLAANVVVFVSAHQIFGDPFVYIFLGLTAGFVIIALDASWRDEQGRLDGQGALGR